MTAPDIHGHTLQAALSLGRSKIGTGAERRRETEILLSLATGLDRSLILSRPDQALTPDQLSAFVALLDRRGRGEPIAYISGRREFWSLDLSVNAATLIPRPETELLVEKALDAISSDGAEDILDLGTGSGAVALAIASERPRCRVIGTDISEDALAVAEGNRRDLGLENVEFRHGAWYEAVAGRRFSIIVSNPPYVADNDPHLAEGDLPFEPPVALSSGPEGLDAIRAIVDGAGRHLRTGGWLMLEHGYDQQNDVCRLLSGAFFDRVATFADLAGQPRVSAGRSGRHP